MEVCFYSKLIFFSNSSIIIPRKCVSTAAICSADIDSLHSTSKVQETVQILAEIISEWNSGFTYCKIPTNKSNHANCQDFVEEVLKRLKIDVKFQGPMNIFLNNLKSKGTSDLAFIPSKDFIEKFHLDKKEYIFKDHKTLDEFVQRLIELDDKFQLSYKHEYNFLKSFDRAFWMRHFKFPNNASFKCLRHINDDNDFECDCPFKDPTETGSIKF